VRRPRPFKPFEKPVPGELFVWVKRVSYFELVIFLGLLFFWIAPGFETETALFGWAHGIGFCGLCAVIWIACVRHEAPYTLLAATLTPFGPIGSVLGIEMIERKGWGIARPEGPSLSPAPSTPQSATERT
jgi:hypothetical protein